jgi:ferredoxin
MPVNIFINMPEKMKRNRIHRGFFQANRFVDMLIKGKTHWRKIPLVSRFMFYFNSGLFKLAELQIHQKIFKIRIEHDKCNKCGLCVKKCPARNISLDSKVIIGNKCQYCFRCVAVCPIKATFGILSPKSLHYKAENASF